MHCFDLAGDSVLKSRALIHLEVEHYTHILLQSSKPAFKAPMKPRDEFEVVALLQRAVRAGLVDEARKLCELICTEVSEQKYFNLYVLEKFDYENL